ncbi:MAG TPA: DUF4148 domain-containing protein [Paucimonas sp.]|nr:DUF4148 domain-containing protein [Paucimonas sp.]
MNARNLIAAVAVFAAAGSAYADVTGNFDDFTNFVSTKTRAEVIAELKTAQAQGQMTHTEWFEPSTYANAGTQTRNEVRAEAIQNARDVKRQAAR